MLDKDRATAVGKQGGYHYNCSLDLRLLNLLGVDPDALMSLAKGDGELLEWILENANNKIALWGHRTVERLPR